MCVEPEVNLGITPLGHQPPWILFHFEDGLSLIK